MNPPASTVRVVSNVYPVKTVTTDQLPGLPERTSGVVQDPEFRRQIWCKRALRKLSNFNAGGVVDDRKCREILLERALVDQAQLETCWDPDYCVDCTPGERPIGQVTKDGHTIVECRCPKPGCPVRNSDNS